MKNVFLLEYPSKQTLAFTTQGGHLSGKLMKNIDFRRPEIIKQFQEVVKQKTPQIGEVITIQNYSFLILRKHYNSRLNTVAFTQAIAAALPALKTAGFLDNLKTTDEDFPEYMEILKSLIPNIEIRPESGWPTNK